MLNKTWIRILPLALLASLVLMACAPAPLAPPPTPTPDPLDLIEALSSAVNQGDTEAALDLFVDEALWYQIEDDSAFDKDSLRNVLDWWSTGASPQDTFTDCQSEGDETACVWERRGECRMGFDVLLLEITFTFKDHRIQRMMGGWAKDHRSAYLAAIDEMLQWLAANDPELGQQLENAPSAPDASGREVGELLVKVCRKYDEAMGR